MKKFYNLEIPDNIEDTEDIVNHTQPAYGLGSHLPMFWHYINGTKERIRGWKGHYHHHEIYRSVNRKLSSYIGWNLNDARSDFNKWYKKKRFPKILNGSYFMNFFDNEFEVDYDGSCNYIIKDNVIVGKVISEYVLRKTRARNYRNEGHKFLGYRITNDALKCKEYINAVYLRFGSDALDFIEGKVISKANLDEINNDYYCDRVWRSLHEYTYTKTKSGRYVHIPPKYKNCRIYEEVHTPDIWVKLTKREKIKRHQAAVEPSFKALPRKKRREAEKVETCYERAMRIAKGKAAESAAENLITIERMGFTKDSFKAFGGQPNLK